MLKKKKFPFFELFDFVALLGARSSKRARVVTKKSESRKKTETIFGENLGTGHFEIFMFQIEPNHEDGGSFFSEAVSCLALQRWSHQPMRILL